MSWNELPVVDDPAAPLPDKVSDEEEPSWEHKVINRKNKDDSSSSMDIAEREYLNSKRKFYDVTAELISNTNSLLNKPATEIVLALMVLVLIANLQLVTVVEKIMVYSGLLYFLVRRLNPQFIVEKKYLLTLCDAIGVWLLAKVVSALISVFLDISCELLTFGESLFTAVLVRVRQR
jgi:hypothetical protein